MGTKPTVAALYVDHLLAFAEWLVSLAASAAPAQQLTEANIL